MTRFMEMKGLTLPSLLFFSLLLSSFASAADRIPPCMDKGKALPIDNEQILDWKENTDNQYKARGHVLGPVSRVFPDRNGHDHFEIKIGPRRNDVLEVVYNQHFGALPEIRVGMQVQACGDYITSYEATPQYPPSPSGGLIHWVHRSTGRHEHGFVVIDGTLYGFGSGAGVQERFLPYDLLDEPWLADEEVETPELY